MGLDLTHSGYPRNLKAGGRKLESVSYNFSKNSQAEHEINTPPGTPRSRSFTRLTIRVGLPHFGQSVLLEVSITFLRSAVFAILAILHLLTKFFHRPRAWTAQQSEILE
jgi:hypothetical protein